MGAPYDIVIVGGGPAGLSLASLAGDHGLRIAIIEQRREEQLMAPAPDGRDIALTHRSVEILKTIGAWSRIPADDMAAIKRVCVKNADQLHALNFDLDRAGQGALGYLVSNQSIRAALYQATKDRASVEFIAGAASDLELGGSLAKIGLASGRIVEAQLVVAADSRFSEMRRRAGIGADIRDFGHTCIVCRLKHEKPHDGTAYEWFDVDRTIAVLPLNNRESSIVLTQPGHIASRTMQMPAPAFAADIERRFAGQWGHMEMSGSRHVYPLVAVYADRFCACNFALIGDAAVGMHPVTAHGFNFGLRGVEILVGKLATAFRAGMNIASASVLESFNREHRAATYPLYIATNALVGLYTDARPPARIARKLILRIGEQLSPIKNFMVRWLTEVGEAHS